MRVEAWDLAAKVLVQEHLDQGDSASKVAKHLEWLF
jgi:hypothetical protein